MVNPVSPSEAKAAQTKRLPDKVIQAVNALLVARSADGTIRIFQDELVDALVAAGIPRERVFDERMLDIEHAFEQVGWKVTHDSPGFNESYRAFWLFKPRNV